MDYLIALLALAALIGWLGWLGWRWLRSDDELDGLTPDERAQAEEDRRSW